MRVLLKIFVSSITIFTSVEFLIDSICYLHLGGERSRESWEFQAEDQDETDDNVRPWLSGFVETHGEETAKQLLQGAGLPKSYRNRDEIAWRSMWINDILNSNETEGTNPRYHEFDAFVRQRYMGDTNSTSSQA